MGLLQQTTSRSSAVTITGADGTGVHMTGPFSGIELNGKTASLTFSGNGIHLNGTGTESGTGSDRNSGISSWGGSSVTGTATDSSITGQESRYIRAGRSGRQRLVYRLHGGSHGIFLSGTSSPAGSER